MKIFFLILIWFAAIAAHADQLESEYLRRLNRAGAADVENVRARFERIRMLRLACGLQMRARDVPVSCFAAEREENMWGLRARADRLALLRRLNDICAGAARALRVPPRESPGLEVLSPVCRARVQEAWKIQAFRLDGQPWSGI